MSVSDLFGFSSLEENQFLFDFGNAYLYLVGSPISNGQKKMLITLSYIEPQQLNLAPNPELN